MLARRRSGFAAAQGFRTARYTGGVLDIFGGGYFFLLWPLVIIAFMVVVFILRKWLVR